MSRQHPNRRVFLKHSAVTVLATGFGVSRNGEAQAQDGNTSHSANSIYLRLVEANDALVPQMIKSPQQSSPSPRLRFFSARGTAYRIQSLAAALCAPESRYRNSEQVIAQLETDTKSLLSAQYPDGTIDSGNLQSPPDTAFVVEPLCATLAVLRANDSNQLGTLKSDLEKFILAAGEALTTGGVHTPNHRWGVCAALARIHALYPNAKYVARIDEWLSEGIDIDADGLYSERSTGNYEVVSDNWFITLARILGREKLLEPARKNLDMMLYYVQPNGEIESIASRRQDHDRHNLIYDSRHIPDNFHLAYRYLAIHDKNGQFAAMTRYIEEKAGKRMAVNLGYFLEEPLLKQELPPDQPLPTSYARFFSPAGVVRIRRQEISATVYGGSDWPLGVASGLASNPTFFTFRKGKAILESMRMIPAFFSKGYFRSSGVKVEGNRYVLHQQLEVPYYQPLPKKKRRPDGDYKLTPAEDRFWSKMDFPNRPKSNIKRLQQEVTITENNGRFQLELNIYGHDNVPVTLELCFRRGGELTGATASPDSKDDYFLEKGTGQYKVGDDVIEFGPGQADHQWTPQMTARYGEQQSSALAEGLRVYITAMTPIKKIITIG